MRKHHAMQKRKNVRWKMYKDQRVRKKKASYSSIYIVLKMINKSGFKSFKGQLGLENRNSKERFWNAV